MFQANVFAQLSKEAIYIWGSIGACPDQTGSRLTWKASGLVKLTSPDQRDITSGEDGMTDPKIWLKMVWLYPNIPLLAWLQQHQLRTPTIGFDHRFCNPEMRKCSDPKRSCDASVAGIADFSIHTSSRLPLNCILRRGNLKSESSFSKLFHISSAGFSSVSVIGKVKGAECTMNLRNNPNSLATVNLTTSLNQNSYGQFPRAVYQWNL